ncbi:ROK family protein [Gryllotalpicola koreensis]|uniref:ROK family protein n=1 Tax=Gryllotalpicola koreensis TaxID=993086 RepID=A0ABP7ZZC3_9MICO
MLDFAFGHEVFDASEVIAATGLTRSTALGVCAELTTRGWLVEVEDARAAGTYSKGRPARRYRLRVDAALVAALDAGEHHVVALVTDLSGAVRGRAEGRFGAQTAGRRLAVIRKTLDAAIADADGGLPIVTVVGIPAPVDASGASPDGDGFWRLMNPQLAKRLDGYGRIVVENDANLAVLAEQSRLGGEAESFAVLLSGERFGAGIMVDGHLLRGRHGGAGELRLLNLVDAVGSADGLGQLAREWGREAARSGKVKPKSPLAATAPEQLTAEDVLSAASENDPVATRIVERLGERLAQIAEILVSLLDVERVVVAGAIAAAAGPIIASAQRNLAENFYPPLPIVAASELGGDVVVLGAVQRALDEVRTDPLSLQIAL